ncbi:MAG: hypothetical protein WCA07_09265 [Gloeobacterales cyanobacterium]
MRNDYPFCEAQLCYLAYQYPENDPEEALVKLLEWVLLVRHRSERAGNRSPSTA